MSALDASPGAISEGWLRALRPQPRRNGRVDRRRRELERVAAHQHAQALLSLPRPSPTPQGRLVALSGPDLVMESLPAGRSAAAFPAWFPMTTAERTARRS